MNIAIIEDNLPELEDLENSVCKILNESNAEFEIGKFSSISDFSKRDREFELVILDLKLPDGSGLELAREIKRNSEKTGIIIVTAYREYVYEGYEVDAFRFIPKPVDPNKMREAILSFLYEKLETQTLFITVEGQKLPLPVNDIVFIESQGNHSTLYLLNGKTLSNKRSISDFEHDISNRQFIRVHRRFLINMKHIKSVKGYEIYFVNNFRAEVSRRNRLDFEQKLISYLNNR